MLRISKEHKVDILCQQNVPAARCLSGETVIFETVDCYDGAVKPDGYRDYEGQKNGLYMANPATGPLYVEGAEPGDGLMVEILDIKVGDWGCMNTGYDEVGFEKYHGERQMKAFTWEDGFIDFYGKKLAMDPMIGVIGVAPEGEGVITVTPDSHGGNMDCRKIVKGSKIMFPVTCSGALLAMGDLHALMGDGEVFGCGMETSGEVTVRVSVVKDAGITQPVLYEGGKVMTVASGKTYEDAVRLALSSMYELLLAGGWEKDAAGRLMSLKCDLVICQIVDPQITVRAVMDEDLIKY